MWMVRVFDNRTEALVEDYPLERVPPLEQLQRLWDVVRENPMYDSYPVYQREAEALSSCISLEYDFDRYSYFLEQRIDEQDAAT